MARDLYINTSTALKRLCSRLKETPWLAVDTEFVREKTYYPELCLIQVASPERIACIDAMTVPALEPLLDLLFDPKRLKVFHASQQDLEIFFRLRGEPLRPVFDTQMVADFLGQGDQIGYGRLVELMTGVTLDKSHSYSNWRNRPLSPEQIRYAADDVRYLREIYLSQREMLVARGQLEWIEEDLATLSDPRRYQLNIERLWQRIRGAQTLKGIQLAALRDLVQWREQRAITENKPRNWIVPDDVLLALARKMPRDAQSIGRLKGINGRRLRELSGQLLDVINATATEPQERWPREPAPTVLQPEQEVLVDVLMAVIRLHAYRHGVNATVVSTRKDIEQLIARSADIPLFKGWRARLAGHEVDRILSGKSALRVDEGQLRLDECTPAKRKPKTSRAR